MEFVLHLGAHRTGTTAVQQACRKNARYLSGRGVTVWGPEVMREPDLRGYVNRVHKGRSDKAVATGVAATRKAISDAIDHLKAGTTARLIVSEENMIGPMDLNFRTGSLYPKTRARLSAYSGLFGQVPAQVFVCIRDYASYWASAYAFVRLRKNLPDFDDLRPSLIGSTRGWLDVLGDIASVFPDSRLVVWTHTGQPQAMSGVFRQLVGAEVAAGMTLRDERINASVSAAVLRQGVRLRRDHPEITGQALQDATAALYTPDAAPFQPFSQPETERMNKRYDSDLAALQAGQVANVEMFDPMAAMK